MRLLALDPATHFGWAISTELGINSGVWDLSVRNNESAGMRLVKLQNHLVTVLGEYEHLDMIVFEATRSFGQARATIAQAELQGIIKMFCEDNCINYASVAPTEVKKEATGKGNAGKDVVLAEMRRKYPSQLIADDNQADALAILDIARKRYGG